MRNRTLALILTAGALSLGLVACGGSSTSSTNASATTGQGPFAALRSAKVTACLKQHGVTLPTRPAGGGRRFRPGGPGATTPRPPSTSSTTPRRPPGGFAGRNSGQFQKLRAALSACGVQLPNRGGGPQGNGAAGPATSS